MGFPLDLALRYMRSRKRAFISVGTAFAILGVSLGTAALSTVMSVTGGFRAEFREKVLGVNAHVLVLKYSSEFPEYREVMKKVEQLPGVTGVAPFVISPMMVTHGSRTATGVLLKGVDPKRVPSVLDLPRHMVEGSLEGLRLPGSKPPEGKRPALLQSRPRSSVLQPPTTMDDRKIEDFDKALEDIIERQRTAPQDETDGNGTEPSPEGEPAPDGGAVALSPDAPSGLIEPEGGYESELPTDDFVPAEVTPDPCKEKGATGALPGVVIGVTLKDTLKAGMGDCIQVTSPTIGYTFAGGKVRPPVAKQFRVVGVFEAGFDQYDSKLIYADLFEAQAFYDGGDTVTGVEMKVADIERSREVVQQVDEALGNAIYHTLDWEELNHGLFTALRIQQILMSLVLALIMVVAAFTVIATLIMVVLDKKREVAVLKAMGATDSALLRSFLYQGLIMGVVGAAAGLGLGYVVCEWILVYGFPLDPKVYFISRLPVQVRPTEFVLTGAFAVLVCLIATVWPALYAARLRPAEAFREQ